LNDSLNLIDYRLFYIVAATFLFGRSQSIISIALAAVWYLYQNILNGQEIISQLIDHNTLVHIGLYFFIGLTLGYVIDKKEKLIRSSRVEVESMKEKYQSLATVLEDALTVKDELQNQMLYTDNSIATVFDIMKNLDSLDTEKIMESTIDILEDVMKTNGAAIYLLDCTNQQFQVEAKSNPLVIPNSVTISENGFLKEAIQTMTVQVNKNLDPDLPSMLAPIAINGTLVGFIGIYNPKFEYLTLAYQNIFQVTANLISSALSRAYEYEKALSLNNQRKNKHFNNKEEAYV
jgi:UDP-glucuronate decarboxylase